MTAAMLNVGNVANFLIDPQPQFINVIVKFHFVNNNNLFIYKIGK
jgi:hypothetical protein